MVLQAIFGLAFVLALLYIILKIMQKYLKTTVFKGTGKDKINITGITYIDDSTKIVSAIHGPAKYVFVVGRNSSLLLDKYENYEKK
jgi:hypothetical protein